MDQREKLQWKMKVSDKWLLLIHGCLIIEHHLSVIFESVFKPFRGEKAQRPGTPDVQGPAADPLHHCARHELAELHQYQRW